MPTRYDTPPPTPVRRELIAHAWDNLAVMVVANVVNAALSAAVLWPVAPHPALMAWVALHILLNLLRVVIANRIKPIGDEEEAIVRAERLFTLMAGVSGLLWGSALLLVPVGEETLIYRVFVVVMLAGMSLGAAVAHTTHMVAYYLFVVPAMVPYAVFLLSLPDRIDQVTGLVTLIFVGLIFFLVRRLATLAMSAIRLRHENNELVADLTESQARFKTLSEASLEGVVIHDGGRIVDCNKAFETMFSVDRNRIVDGSLADYLSSPALPDREGLLFEGEGAGPDGARFPTELLTQSMVYRGRPVKVTLVRDLTDRRRAETALTESERRYRLLADNVRDVIWITDLDGVFTYLSPSVTRLTGYRPEELIGENVGVLLTPASAEQAKQAFDYLKTHGERMREAWLMEHVRKDRRHVWVEVVGSLITDDTGAPRELIGVTRDVTDRVNAQEEMRGALEKAETATRMKDRFVSMAAHDLRSPFSAMITLVDTLRADPETKLSPLGRAVFDQIASGAETVMTMIDRMLNLGRLQEGALTPRMRFVDVGPLLNLVTATYRPLAEKREIELRNRVTDRRRVWADPDLLEQALHNLVSNAIKFTPAHGHVFIDASAEPPTRLIVTDTGVGAPPEMVDDLFRADVKTTRPGARGERGAGLGLPFSHDMVEAMGGTLAYEPNPTGGSRFVLTLADRQPVILVVDNDANQRLLYAARLKTLDVLVVEAASGEEALTAVDERTPDVVICDLMTPVTDGFALLKALRARPDTVDTPVIMVTGDDAIESRERAFRHGASDFVTKGEKTQDLLPRVSRYIS